MTRAIHKPWVLKDKKKPTCINYWTSDYTQLFSSTVTAYSRTVRDTAASPERGWHPRHSGCGRCCRHASPKHRTQPSRSQAVGLLTDPGGPNRKAKRTQTSSASLCCEATAALHRHIAHLPAIRAPTQIFSSEGPREVPQLTRSKREPCLQVARAGYLCKQGYEYRRTSNVKFILQCLLLK